VVNVHGFGVVAYVSHAVHELVLLMHICETPLVESEADNVTVTEVVFVYVALLLMIIELFGGVLSSMTVSEQDDEVFPAPSLYHTYTVFVPSPLVNVHAFGVVVYVSHDEHDVVLLMHI
jgi:hypothetical protein